MPEPLRRAIHQLVSEAVANCQEVLRYTEEDRAQVAGLMGEKLSYEMLRAPVNRMRHQRGQQQAERAQRPEEDPQKLFTEAVLHGLRARLCDDVDSLDSYLPPHVAELARKVASVLEEPQPATA